MLIASKFEVLEKLLLYLDLHCANVLTPFLAPVLFPEVLFFISCQFLQKAYVANIWSLLI